MAGLQLLAAVLAVLLVCMRASAGTAASSGSLGPSTDTLSTSTGIVSGNTFTHASPYSSRWFRGNSSFNHGQMPYAGAGYQVFRNVKDFGAVGDGVHDDSDAINNATSQGSRCWDGCLGTTTKGAVVFFPPGKYLVKKPLVQYYFTEFIGDPNDRPIIIGDANFVGYALVDTNPYDAQSRAKYIDSINFYRQIRNFIFDTTNMPAGVQYGGPDGGRPLAIHWSVGQACSLQNLEFRMRGPGPNVRDMGIYVENGSGGFMSNLTFTGGDVSILAASQEFLARGLIFRGCKTGIRIRWGVGFTFKDIDMEDCEVGFDLNSNFDGISEPASSLVILDSSFRFVNSMINTNHLPGTMQPAITLDNIEIKFTALVVNSVNMNGDSVNGAILQFPGVGTGQISSWAMGRQYNQTGQASDTQGYLPVPNKPVQLLDGQTRSKFFTRNKPQYEHMFASDVLSVLDFGARNDGTGDNTNALNQALLRASTTKQLLVFPAGIYTVNDTVYVPPDTRMTGILWPQIMGVGLKFADQRAPRPVFMVGKPGEIGAAEISELLFTAKGASAGAILVQWNMKARDQWQGYTGLWDCIFRVGGAKGTNLGSAECPRGYRSTICMGAYQLLHVTPSSSGYFENNYFWTADHDIDSQYQSTVDVFTGRGVSIESQGPTWFYSAASEHAQMYQWQVSNAKNLFFGLVEGETPYYQPSVDATVPFTINTSNGDPTFSWCNGLSGAAAQSCKMALGMQIINSSSIFTYGGAFYSWYKSYEGSCGRGTNGTYCQDRLMEVVNSGQVYLYDLYSVGANEVVSTRMNNARSNVAYKADNQHGFATAIAAWLAASLPRS